MIQVTGISDSDALKIIGVVLAGGLSSRMQRDKTQLIWQGNTLLEHCTDLLTRVGCADVLVSSNSKGPFIADRYPLSGPLAGIDACLQHILLHTKDADAMLIMPVDMPLMTDDLLQGILKRATKDTAVFYTEGRFPLILPVNNTLSELLTHRLDSSNSGKGVSIKNLLAHLNCLELDIDKDQQSAFYNCNTPEQWQNLVSK